MRIIHSRGQRPDAVRVIRETARALARVSPETAKLRIRIAPAPCVTNGRGFGWGAFDDPPGEVLRPTSYIAGEKPDDIGDEDWLSDMLPHVLAHEWAHYEQWRDGKPVRERGVEARARELLRLIGCSHDNRVS